jgi:hypothetical protein
VQVAAWALILWIGLADTVLRVATGHPLLSFEHLVFMLLSFLFIAHSFKA